MVEISNGPVAFHKNFAHVGDIEKTAGRAHGHVLADYAGFILNREAVSAEFHHLSALGYVDIIQGRLFSIHPSHSFTISGIMRAFPAEKRKRAQNHTKMRPVPCLFT